MPHRLRCDHPGSWHHVFARGFARRTVFETRRDTRLFLCLLALDVRRGALVLRVALLRDMAGLRYTVIAQRCRTSITEARTCYRQHAARLLEDAEYASTFSAIACGTLNSLHRPRPRAR